MKFYICTYIISLIVYKCNYIILFFFLSFNSIRERIFLRNVFKTKCLIKYHTICAQYKYLYKKCVRNCIYKYLYIHFFYLKSNIYELLH